MGGRERRSWRCPGCAFRRGVPPCRGADGRLRAERLARALWLNCQGEADSPLQEQTDWVMWCVYGLAAEAPEAALEVVLAALAFFDSKPGLAYLAAGPLQELVSQQGPRLIERIERAAADDLRFRYLLSGIRGEAETDPAVWRRVQAAVAPGPWLDDDPRTPQGSALRQQARRVP